MKTEFQCPICGEGMIEVFQPNLVLFRAKHVKFTSQDSYYPSLEDRVSPKDQMTLMYKLAIHLCNDLSAYTKV